MKKVAQAASILFGAAGSTLLVTAGAFKDIAELFPGMTEFNAIEELQPAAVSYSGNVSDFNKFKQDKEEECTCENTVFDSVDDETSEFISIDDVPHLVLRSGNEIILLDPDDEVTILCKDSSCEACSKIRNCVNGD